MMTIYVPLILSKIRTTTYPSNAADEAAAIRDIDGHNFLGVFKLSVCGKMNCKVCIVSGGFS
jgi:hypothetical protein